MSINKKNSPGVETVMLKSIFAVVRPVVRVDLSPGIQSDNHPILEEYVQFLSCEL
jgi:hypothetical protein